MSLCRTATGRTSHRLGPNSEPSRKRPVAFAAVCHPSPSCPTAFSRHGPPKSYDACVVVWDRDGQALAYVYFEDEPRRRAAAKLLTREEARQVAADIIKLPELLRRP